MIYFVIIVSNILIAVIFYLIISLKIEKSTKDYHSKKMKREMEEMIREFNATADRNISLLENKISTMKKIIKSSGLSPNIEIEINDKNATDKVSKKFSNDNTNKNILDNDNNDIGRTDKQSDFNSLFKNSRKKLKKIFQGSGKNDLHPSGKNNLTVSGNNSIDFLVNEKISVEQVKGIGEANDEIYTDIEIKNLFANRDDTNNLIAELFKKGYSIEILSKYSGIPSGELKLILNLNNAF